MNVLVLNLTRFGDLLQSAAAIRSLAYDADGRKNRIGLVCIENFTVGAELLPEIEDLFPLPGGALIKALRQTPGDPGALWLNGMTRLRDWLPTITDRFAPDLVCNISPFPASALLARLLAGEKETTGFCLDALGFAAYTTPWANFMQGATILREVSPFNVVDLFRKIAGDASIAPDASLLPVPKAPLAAMRKRLQAAAPPETTGFIALQLGASAAIRCWPAASFAEVGDALWESMRLLPVLLGTKNEAPLGEAYAESAKGPHINLIGETNLMELGATLSASALLVSNDTGTLHLASGLGVPALGIYLATAQPWDTGPYATGNCSIEPDLPCHPCNFSEQCRHDQICRTTITPTTVIRLATAKISQGSWIAANFADATTAKGSRVWESAQDSFGFADLVSLSGHETAPRTLWMRLQRHYYRQFFDRDIQAPFNPELYSARAFQKDPSSERLAKSLGETVALFDALLLQSEMILSKPAAQIHDRFRRMCLRLENTLQSTPKLSAIEYLWRREVLANQDLDATPTLMRQYRELFAAMQKSLF